MTTQEPIIHRRMTTRRRCGKCRKVLDQPGCGRHRGRGLCGPCGHAVARRGQLIDYPRINRTRDELMHEWELLRSEGHTLSQAADRLGIARGTLKRAYQRARAAGDPRAQPPIPSAGQLNRITAGVTR